MLSSNPFFQPTQLITLAGNLISTTNIPGLRALQKCKVVKRRNRVFHSASLKIHCKRMLLDFKSAISVAQTQQNTGMKKAGVDWSVLL